LSEQKKWSWFGQYDKSARPSGISLALAVVFAGETFLDVKTSYPLYMSILALAVGAFAVFTGFRSKAALGLVLGLISLAWLNPLLGGDWFNSLSVAFLRRTHC